MAGVISKLPPTNVKVWTDEQKIELNYQRNVWKWISARIDYLQLIQAGYLPEDPLNDFRFDTAQRVQIDLASRFKFAQLNLIIAGWEWVKKEAIAQHRDFYFQNPRELFADFCRQEAEAGLGDCLSKDVNQGVSVQEIRKFWTDQSAFYRDRLPHQNEEQLLEIYRDSKFWDFLTIYSIWNYRHRPKEFPKIHQAWKAYLKSHKDWASFWCGKKPVGGCRLTTLRWNFGHPVLPNGKKAIFELLRYA